MPNTSYVGSGAYFAFAGTAISAQFRNISDNQDAAVVDGSAGADTFRRNLCTLADGRAELEIVLFSDGGTIWNGWNNRTQGTLIYGEEGTANGKPKTTVLAQITGKTKTVPYDGIVVGRFTFGYLEAPTLATWS